MRAPMILAASGVLAVFFGCADYDLAKGSADTASAPGEDADSGSAGSMDDTAASADDTAAVDPPELYGIGGSLEVSKGLISGGVVTLTFEDETRDIALTCPEDRTIAAVEQQKQTPDGAIFTWVRLDLDAAKDPCVGSTGVLDSKEGLYLGLGELHPDLLPALAGAGFDTEAAPTQLYGVYAAVPGEDTCAGDSQGASACVFGYGGTQANLDGLDDAATKAPLPDGTYLLQHVYLFDVD